MTVHSTTFPADQKVGVAAAEALLPASVAPAPQVLAAKKFNLRKVLFTGAALAALAGAVVKLAYPRRYELGSTAFYLVMGWAVIIFMQPLVVALDRPILILLVSGGVLYTIGACVHHWGRLPFHNAIWHSLVLGAAGLHYAAIVYGIVLPASAS